MMKAPFPIQGNGAFSVTCCAGNIVGQCGTQKAATDVLNTKESNFYSKKQQKPLILLIEPMVFVRIRHEIFINFYAIYSSFG